jgi:hypothetical protein
MMVCSMRRVATVEILELIGKEVIAGPSFFMKLCSYATRSLAFLRFFSVLVGYGGPNEQVDRSESDDEDECSTSNRHLQVGKNACITVDRSK